MEKVKWQPPPSVPLECFVPDEAFKQKAESLQVKPVTLKVERYVPDKAFEAKSQAMRQKAEEFRKLAKEARRLMKRHEITRVASPANQITVNRSHNGLIKWREATFNGESLDKQISLSDLPSMSVEDLDLLHLDLDAVANGNNHKLRLIAKLFQRRASAWQETRSKLDWVKEQHCTEFYFMQAAKNLLPPEQYQNILSHAKARHQLHLARLAKARIAQEPNFTKGVNQ